MTTGDERIALETVCSWLVEQLEDYYEIDGDGDEGSIITDHIERLIEQRLAAVRTDLSEASAMADVLAVHLKSLCYHADNFEHRYEGPGRACAGCYDALVAYDEWKT